ncbi:MAG: cytochrome C [Nitrospinae bacterium]|nr:cytochrome C [Nitrospinota bacterium]
MEVKRTVKGTGRMFVLGVAFFSVLLVGWEGHASDFSPRRLDRSIRRLPPKVRIGLEIALSDKLFGQDPVKLQAFRDKLEGLDRRGLVKVGLGSYIVNANGDCNGCHTWLPGNTNWAPGGNPFQGQPKHINVAGYLAGGRVFQLPPPPNGPGPVTSRNLTPDKDGLPAGMTEREFIELLRTGREEDEPDKILQVMPWPVIGEMTNDDLKAIYAFLSVIPCVESTGHLCQ